MGLLEKIKNAINLMAINSFYFIIYTFRRAKQDRVFRVAASLSYTSMLAFIPFLAICLAIFSAFPVFDNMKNQLKDFLFSNFVPHASKSLENQVFEFVNATGGLTTLGVVGIAITAILLLSTIETAFNAIFRIDKARTLIARVLVYWTALTLGPLLLGTSFSLSGYFFAIQKWVNQEVVFVSLFLPYVVPSLLLCVAFMLLYITIPNKTIKITHALVGGIISAVLFVLLRKFFGIFVANAGTYHAIYGAMAALPLFLIWMYLSWSVVLIGAVITASLPEWNFGVRMKTSELSKHPESIREMKIITAFSILKILNQGLKQGKRISQRHLIKSIKSHEGVLLDILDVFTEQNIITKSQDKEWVLSINPEEISVYDIYRILEIGVEEIKFENTNLDENKKLKEAVEKASSSVKKSLDIKLSEVL